MSERDQALLESVQTHRARLGSAIAFGSLGARRPLTSLTRRLVACAACVGVSFVGSILAANAAAAEQAETPAPPPSGTPATPTPTEGTAP